MYTRNYTGDKVQIQSFIEQIDEILYIFIEIKLKSALSYLSLFKLNS